MKERSGNHWLVWLAMCGMIGATLGVKNTSGVFFTPMAESFGVGRGAISLTLTLSNLLLAAGDFFSPRLYTGGNFRRLTRLCVACAVGATLLMGMVSDLWLLYLLHCVRGFASGMMGIVIGTVVINNWFVRCNSLVTGVALAAGGVVSALLSPLLSGVIEASGWRAGFRAEAVAALVLYAPLLVLPLAYRPEDMGLAPLGGQRKSAAQAPDGGKSQAADSSRPLFAALVLMTAFANTVSTFPNHLPGLADSYALSASVGAAMLSASMIANALGKVAMGALAERFGVKRPALAYAAVLALGLGLLLAFRTVPAALAGGAILGLAFSLTTVVPALVTKDVFGAERYRAVFPAVTLAGTVANASAASLIGFLYDAAGSYHPAMLLLIALLGAISLLLLFLYRNRRESY